MNHRIACSAALVCAALALNACGSVDLLSFGGVKEQDPTRPPPGATVYQCDAGKHLYVRYMDNGAAAWVILPERAFRLDKAGAGARYSNGSDTLEVGGDAATLSDGANVTYAGCKAKKSG